jgi:hypothetical protein
MRYWDDKDANGNKLTDGRICLVIKSDDNPDMPEIRTYGKDKEEVLDKVAKTAETAQGQIYRMRKTPSNPPANRPAVPASSAPAGSGDLVTAVADLANPAKAGQAVKTLLKSVGVDVDQQQRLQALRNVAALAEKWEREHSDYPKDPRNDRILMKMAANLAGGAHRITAEHLDAAFEEAKRDEMLHEPKPVQAGNDSTVQPDGNPDSRTVRNATSYRRNGLRSPEPGAGPTKETAKEERWRNILEKGTGKALEEAIKTEPGFSEWVEKQQLRKTA